LPAPPTHVSPPAPVGPPTHAPTPDPLHDLIDKLVPHHSLGDWLYSQGATAIGVLIALYAARRAWKSVQAQIKANQTHLTKQIDAENDRQRRKERLDALTGAAEVVTEVWTVVWHNLGSRTPDDLIRDVVTMEVKVATVKARLYLLGMTDEGNAVEGFWHRAQRAGDRSKAEALKAERKSLVEDLMEAMD
jgi:hypothetical protein